MNECNWKPEVGKLAMSGFRVVEVLCIGNEFTFFREKASGLETAIVTSNLKEFKGDL